MEFQVKCKLEENCLSKKGVTYNRIILDFGDFQKMVVLTNLELLYLKDKLKENR